MEEFFNPVKEMLISINTLNGTSPFNEKGEYTGFGEETDALGNPLVTDAQKLASTIVGLSEYTGELLAMGGWTPQKAVQMANQRRAILANLRADNAQKDPSEQLSDEEIEAEAQRQYMQVFLVEMDPGRSAVNYFIDSLNSRLGTTLIGPESGFVRSLNYAAGMMGEGS